VPVSTLGSLYTVPNWDELPNRKLESWDPKSNLIQLIDLLFICVLEATHLDR